MKKNRLEKLTLIAIFSFILIIFVNGRSFLGVYILGFRIAEYLTGLAVVSSFFIVFKYKFFKNYVNLNLIGLFCILIGHFIISNLLNNINFLNTYLYKSSIFIWYISFFFIGITIFKGAEISKRYFFFGYLGLGIQYVFNVLYYPEAIEKFFNTYSDKTQFLKGSEIAIFFIVVTFFGNRLLKGNFRLDFFVIASSIYFPLSVFKSRSAGFALGLYIIAEIYNNRKYFLEDIRKTLILSTLSFSIFAYSSFSLTDAPPEIIQTDDAIAQVFKHKYVVSNTYDGKVPFIYIDEGRIFSADGNLNWRFQLWQDLITDSIQRNNVVFGLGYSEKSPIFEDVWYAGLDGTNENSHNYLLNVFVRAGLFGVFFVLLFFYELIKTAKKNFTKQEFLLFLIPLVFISFFDGSMENPYFACTFYFFAGSFISGIKSKSERFTKNNNS
tara:strand:+ start:8594 stop:9910 length:1317 start_codon:yes stop_codon:yes gene_type:complete